MKLDERIPGEDGAVLQLEGVDVGELEAGGPADELLPADLLLRVAGDPDDAALVVEAVVVVVPVGAPQVVPALVVLALAAARVAERAVRGRRGRHEQEKEPTQLHDLLFYHGLGGITLKDRLCWIGPMGSFVASWLKGNKIEP